MARRKKTTVSKTETSIFAELELLADLGGEVRVSVRTVNPDDRYINAPLLEVAPDGLIVADDVMDRVLVPKAHITSCAIIDV